MALLRAYAIAALASAGLFAGAVLISQALSSRAPTFSTFWLPSGVYLALLLRSPHRAWPAIIGGALAANAGIEQLTYGRGWWPALGFASANTLEAVLAAVLLRAFGGVPELARVVHVLRFVAVTLLTAAIPGGLVGSLVVRMHFDAGFIASWVTWWVSDLIGILVVTPAALIPAAEWRQFGIRLRTWRGLEAAAAFLALVGVSTVVYWQPPHPVRATFLLLPFLFWTTFRFGAPGLSVSVGLTTVIAVRGTLNGLGPFAMLRQEEALLTVQLFVCVTVACFLLLSATLREREASLLQARHHEQDALVRRFADTAPAVLWAATLDGERTFLSRGWEELTGESAASGLGGGWLHTVHPDDRAAVAQTGREAAASGAPYESRYRVRRADGAYRWVMSAARPQHGEDGRVLGYVGSLIDVHDQAAAATALARADALLDAVFRSAPVGLAFLDRDLRFQRINERLAAINGLPIAAHIGNSPADLLPGIDDMAGLLGGFRDIIETGRPQLGVEVTGETPAAPGARHFWRENFFPVMVEGDVVGVGVVAEDVTEQKRTEQALRDSEARFRKLAEEGPVMVWVTAGDRLQYVSPRWSDYTGRPLADDTALSSFFEAVHPEDRARLAAEWLTSPAGTTFETEFRLRGRAGDFRWFLTRGVAMPTDVQDVQRVGACVDIHDRKAAERELLDSTRRKDEFLAMLAHELRNPLAPIQNAVHLLGIAPPGSAAHASAREIIARQLGHIIRLVDDLLDVSRLSRGKLSIRREPTDLAEVLRETAVDHGPQLAERHLAFEVDLPATAVWTEGDRTRLAQAIGNLLHNAQKFTPPGGTVRMRLTADGQAGEAVIAVEDTGIGMTDDLRARVFDEFSQGAQSLDRTPGGLGLGLALVKRFAELHGGRAEALSPGPGRGSTFIVRLPLMTTGSVQDQGAATSSGVTGRPPHESAPSS